MDVYKHLLEELRDHLLLFGAVGWGNRLSDWILELGSIDDVDLSDHLARTRQALGGMGSIGDIELRADHYGTQFSGAEVDAANEKTRQLIERIDEAVESLTASRPVLG